MAVTSFVSSLAPSSLSFDNSALLLCNEGVVEMVRAERVHSFGRFWDRPTPSGRHAAEAAKGRVHDNRALLQRSAALLCASIVCGVLDAKIALRAYELRISRPEARSGGGGGGGEGLARAVISRRLPTAKLSTRPTSPMSLPPPTFRLQSFERTWYQCDLKVFCP